MSRRLQAELQRERAVSRGLLDRLEGVARDNHCRMPNHGTRFETCNHHECQAYRYAAEEYHRGRNVPIWEAS